MWILLKELFLKNFKVVLVIAVVGFVVYFLWSTATSVATLGEQQKQMSKQIESIGESVNQLKVLGEQTRDIQQQQMALTQRISSEYDKESQDAQATTGNLLGAVSDGSFRLRIKKPSAPVTIPYRNVAGANGIASPGAASSPDATRGSDGAKANH
ncbi:hypothetical protein RAY_15 [Erwinia phage vB_EamM_RAY]|jgi:predicted PurR-regulated permease PerM|uniref:Uncharacterized protein n=10 Tax=Agricanvirus TaxID=1984776 RepID=A0A173GDR6_9CAUD|nr:Rz-like spanin [Erwinia phage Ea35-70]YP_009605158.1 Rz-like spanin [Erwinia phage vB_EamM_Deimos-Minion]YP_009605482.1 Rz-like spanin [Erwinia phage vB_EamM_RAY]YP_009605800.1 Rz-like spanin [Erwinia phage vB_EamM_Simmy50]YP_009606121.1 Rz-like spanin [Erwinia phage vB_EamM_Special G]YP_009621756.1 Rz-like spanin [Erwinia phage vB_EamM_Desertfox]AUG85803.1 hypothetical protein BOSOLAPHORUS_15 [Erwinia phage vB_EamM_Bosolaphorus]AUG86443.1 hypothetical protein MADMEL_15 [Erwinia phage vB_